VPTTTTADPADGVIPVRRGRPRLVDDDALLAAALRSFASNGFDAMSVRSLNAELGLSHAAVSQRFGSKDELFTAAVGHGLELLLEDIATVQQQILDDQDRPDDLAVLQSAIRAFLEVGDRRPEIGQLMNREGLQAGPRLDFILETLGPLVESLGPVVERLVGDGVIHPVGLRTLFFLSTHGAAGPFTLSALSASFDPIDGPLERGRYVAEVTDIIMRGITV
jgi:AcrR family transcriptional regulator